jgi:cytochrome c
MCRLACTLMIGFMLACDSGSDDPEDAAPASGRGGAGAGSAGAGGAAGAAADGGSAAPDEDASIDDAGGSAREPLRVQVFSRTLGFRHDSIAPAQDALRAIAVRQKASFTFTEDSAQLIAQLPQTDVVVFLMTTGDVLDAAQQTSFESFIRAGGGYVGVHSATDTEYDWPFYGQLAGAWFKDHPAVQKAKVLLDAPQHPIVSFLPVTWERSDEWYNFRENPRGKVDVLLRLDESSYSGGNMGSDHPIAWCHSIDKGRAFYTGFGHTNESWQEPMLLELVERALVWVAGR